MKKNKKSSGNIVLVGMMGAGKSSFGKKLASKSGKIFVDLDDVISQKEKMAIADIFGAFGEDYFRKVEHECLKTALENSNMVLATGGGTPCFFENMTLINQNSFSVYLSGNSRTLLKRMGENFYQRPLLSFAQTEQERINILDQLLEQRKAYYMLADMKVEIIGLKSKNILDAYSNYCK